MERKQGYYWVKHTDTWHLAQWCTEEQGFASPFWLLHGIILHYQDKNFQQISELRIPDPEDLFEMRWQDKIGDYIVKESKKQSKLRRLRNEFLSLKYKLEDFEEKLKELEDAAESERS